MMFAGSTMDKVNFVIQVPIMLTLALTGLVGNVLSFCVLGIELKKSSTFVFLRALAITDNAILVAYVFYFSLRAVYQHTGYFVAYFEIFQYFRIQLFTLMVFFKVMGVYLIVFVTTERYIAVCKPLQAQSLCTVKHAYYAILLLVIVSFIYKFPNSFLMDVAYKFDPCSGSKKPLSVTSDFANNVIVDAVFVNALPPILECIIPVAVMIFLNYHLINTLQSSELHVSQEKRKHQSTSLTRRVFAVSVIFMILETPMHVIGLVHVFGYYVMNFSPDTLMFFYSIVYNAYILSTINSFINFYVYCLTGKEFRKALVRMFKRDNRQRSE
jgi:hypothetical protein